MERLQIPQKEMFRKWKIDRKSNSGNEGKYFCFTTQVVPKFIIGDILNVK